MRRSTGGRCRLLPLTSGFRRPLCALVVGLLLWIDASAQALSFTIPARSFEGLRQNALHAPALGALPARYRWLLRFWRGEYQGLLDVDQLESDLARSGSDEPPPAVAEMLDLTRFPFRDYLVAEIRRLSLATDEKRFLVLLLDHVLAGTTTRGAYDLNLDAQRYLETRRTRPELAAFVSRRIMVPLPPLVWTVGFSVRPALGFVEDTEDYSVMGIELLVRYGRLVTTIVADAGWGSVLDPDSGETRYFAGATLGYRLIPLKSWALLPGIGAGAVGIQRDEDAMMSSPRVFSPTIVGSAALEFFGRRGDRLRVAIGVEGRRPILGNRSAAEELLLFATFPLACGSSPRGGMDGEGLVVSCISGR